MLINFKIDLELRNSIWFCQEIKFIKISLLGLDLVHHMNPRAADFRPRILDNGLLILNLSGLCWLVMSHPDSWLIYLQRENDTLIQVSYHTQTAFATQKRAPKHSRLKDLIMFIPFDRLAYGVFIMDHESMTSWVDKIFSAAACRNDRTTN